jgi:methionyl-tRNA synthetase
MKKILVCSAWPYASNIPHLGNLMSSLLSGDVFARYYKLRGHEVVYVSGSEAHGTRIEYEAAKASQKPQEFAERIHHAILQIIEAFGIEFDNYTWTESPVHKEFVTSIHEKMVANGYILTREEERAYCQNCEKFLADRYIEGTCPRCGYEQARGNQCDRCGTLLEPEELIDPRCTVCGGTDIIFKKTKHWYLDLQKLEPQLREYIGSRDFRGNVKLLTENMLRDLRPRAITRDIEWGIPAPFEGAEGKVIYVWAEAALGYVSATIEYFQERGEPERWREFWFGDDVFQVYTQAKDNIPFHTIIFPGQLIASGEGYHLPDQISATEYLNWIGGEAFSKSRGIGIYCDDALELLDPTLWRFYLLYARPEKKDVDFSWEELEKSINGVLIDNISNLVNRVVALTNRLYDGEVEATPEGRVLEEIRRVKEGVEREVEGGSLAPALRRIAELAVFGNHYFQEERPWEGGKPEAVASGLQLVKALAILLEPFVPAFSGEIYRLLGLEGPLFDDILKVELPFRVGPASPLLRKIEIEEVKRHYGELKGGTVEAA